MKRNVIVQRILFSLCLNYKKHKLMYDELFEKIKNPTSTDKNKIIKLNISQFDLYENRINTI